MEERRIRGETERGGSIERFRDEKRVIDEGEEKEMGERQYEVSRGGKGKKMQ